MFSKLKIKYKLNQGMTYIELIVVLGIFSVMTSVLMFNYKSFQENVDMRILANDIAMKIVEAQKASVSGKWNINAGANWKPSYGLYFDSTKPYNFIYFTDLNNNSYYESENASCDVTECLNYTKITKGSYISNIDSFLSGINTPLNSVSITFKRPNSEAVFNSDYAILNPDYVQITLSSLGSTKSYIKIYPSGRIQFD